MNKVVIYKWSLIATLVFIFLGAFLKIMHYPHGSILLTIGLVSCIGYIILGLVDVFSDKKLNLPERLMWLIGFIFISWITAIVYYPSFKRRNQV